MAPDQIVCFHDSFAATAVFFSPESVGVALLSPAGLFAVSDEFAESDAGAEAAFLALRLSLTYQPEPLKTMPTGCGTLPDRAATLWTLSQRVVCELLKEIERMPAIRASIVIGWHVRMVLRNTGMSKNSLDRNSKGLRTVSQTGHALRSRVVVHFVPVRPYGDLGQQRHIERVR